MNSNRRNFCKKTALLPLMALPLGAFDEAEANPWLIGLFSELIEVVLLEGAEARALAAAAGEAAVGMAVEEAAVLAAGRSVFMKGLVRNASKAYDGIQLFEKLASVSSDLPEAYLRHQNVINTVFERGDDREHQLILTVANNSVRSVNAIMRVIVTDMDSGAVELNKAYRVQSPPLYRRKFQAQIIQFASSGAKTLHIVTNSSNIQVPDKQSFFVI